MRVSHRRTARIAAVCFAAVASCATHLMPDPVAAQVPQYRQGAVAVALFEQRVSDYATLHRLLEGAIPPLRPTTRMDEIRVNIQELATRIRHARSTARQGDMFDPEVNVVIRRIIARALPAEEWRAFLAERAKDEDGRPVPLPTLTVNMDWPQGVPFDFVPAQLLKELPSLPPELQYRIIGRSLVLWDHHANLIVDFLPEAFLT